MGFLKLKQCIAVGTTYLVVVDIAVVTDASDVKSEFSAGNQAALPWLCLQ